MSFGASDRTRSTSNPPKAPAASASASELAGVGTVLPTWRCDMRATSRNRLAKIKKTIPLSVTAQSPEHAVTSPNRSYNRVDYICRRSEISTGLGDIPCFSLRFRIPSKQIHCPIRPILGDGENVVCYVQARATQIRDTNT